MRAMGQRFVPVWPVEPRMASMQLAGEDDAGIGGLQNDERHIAAVGLHSWGIRGGIEASAVRWASRCSWGRSSALSARPLTSSTARREAHTKEPYSMLPPPGILLYNAVNGSQGTNRAKTGRAQPPERLKPPSAQEHSWWIPKRDPRTLISRGSRSPSLSFFSSEGFLLCMRERAIPGNRVGRE